MVSQLPKKITSVHNPEIKRVRLLQQKSRARKKHGLFVIEGMRELKRALHAGYELEQIVMLEGITMPPDLHPVNAEETISLCEVSTTVFEKISFRSSTEKAIFLAKSKSHTLQTLTNLPKHPSILVVEAPEKPGNMGALFRTAVAANMDAVIIVDPKTDVYHPNCIRASLGCVFEIPTATASAKAAHDFLKQYDITILAAALHAKSIPYHHFHYPNSCALVMGAEDTGVSPFWLEHATALLEIPMAGSIDSLNLSVSAGILMYELRKNQNRLP